MKKFIKDGSSGSFIKANIIGIICGVIAMLVLTLLSAVIMSSAGMSNSTAKIFSIIILCASALVCGLAAAKKAENKKLLTGTASGVFLYLIVAVISAAVTKSGFTSAFLIRLLICVVSAAVGALLITLKTNNKKYI